jgi:myotubularin-related protein 14
LWDVILWLLYELPMTVVDRVALQDLFQWFTQYTEIPPIRRNTPSSQYYIQVKRIQDKVNGLFKKDYNIATIPNINGDLCATYPLELAIIENEKQPGSSGLPNKKVNNAEELVLLFQKGRFARVRTRFPVPVILYNNKNICRSATLSHKVECYLQKTYNQIASSSQYLLSSTMSSSVSGVVSYDEYMGEAEIDKNQSEMDKQRTTDIALIKKLNVKYICDLMVENKKKKFGFEVCSSEKVDMHGRYAPFVIVPIPYPGIEFFREFNQNQHCAEQLYFDWDSAADITRNALLNAWLPITVTENSSWDLISLTKNYFKLILHFVADPEGDSGVLIHCISGWDRTPMMISLIRMSLWADSKIHQSLSAEEMLYVTVAYDWALFGHQLADRASRGEDIFYFCFYFLDFISSSDFSIDNIAIKCQETPIAPSLKIDVASSTRSPANSRPSTPSKQQPEAKRTTTSSSTNGESPIPIPCSPSKTAPLAITPTSVSPGSSSHGQTTPRKRKPSEGSDEISPECGSWQLLSTSLSPPSALQTISPVPSPRIADMPTNVPKRKSSDASDAPFSVGSWQFMEGLAPVLDMPIHVPQSTPRDRRKSDDYEDAAADVFCTWDKDTDCQVFPITDIDTLNVHEDPRIMASVSDPSMFSNSTGTLPTATSTINNGNQSSKPGHKRAASGSQLTSRAVKLAQLQKLFMELFKECSPTKPIPEPNKLWSWLPKFV